ncbi:MAG: hypothetical protein Q7S09_05645 [bacterium]|nr:hypothetical protein [bacterium]
MKSLERRFKNISEKKPLWSTHTCFALAIQEQDFGTQAIHRWFNRLVSNDDYAKNEKRAILRHLEKLTKPVRTTGIEDQTSLCTALDVKYGAVVAKIQK